MTSWQRFKHAFVKCNGPVVKREYFPPRYSACAPMKEFLYGVTLLHCTCRTCNRDWTNRELGDWRKDSEA